MATRAAATRKPAASKRTSAPRIGSAAVAEKTGRGWAEWISVLDAAGGRTMSHREIVALVGGRFGVGPWWRQMVTVGYEQSRGLREVHQVASGFTAGVSRTVAVPCARLAAAFENARTRATWLKTAGVTVRSATKGKVIRFDAPAGTRIEARFTAKGTGRSSVAIEHTRLKDAKAVAASKALWKTQLDRLLARLEA